MKVIIPPSRPEKAEYVCWDCKKGILINDIDVIQYFQNKK